MAKKKKKLPFVHEENLVKYFQPKTDKQKELINLIYEKEVVIIKGSPGSGKTFVSLATALNLLGDKYKQIILVKSLTTVPEEELGFLRGPQPLYSKIITPNGETTMGDIQVGDIITGADGLPTRVVDISDIKEDTIYEIELGDGRTTRASSGHFWNVRVGYSKGYETITTLEMFNNLEKERYFLPLHGVVQYNKNKLPLDPYLLGVLIGDGIIADTHIRFSSNDQEIVDNVEKIVSNLNLLVVKNKSTEYSYDITTGFRGGTQAGAREMYRENILTGEVEILGFLQEACKKLKDIPGTTLIGRCTYQRVIDNWEYGYTGKISKNINPIQAELEELGLMGLRAWEKFIPDVFKYSSVQDRISLLQGLLDTDGTIKKDGSDLVYITSSEQLQKDVIDLVLSLGGTAKSYGRFPKNTSIVGTELKSSPRKIYSVYINFYNNEIIPFRLTRKAERFKPKTTHNYATRIKSISKLGVEEVKCIKIDNGSELYLTDSFIPTHNSLEDKMDPYIMSFTWNIDKLCGYGAAKSLMDKKLISVLPIAFARGISIDNSIVIVDEAQNLSHHTFKTLLTRIGDNSKYIFMGDVEQIDRRNKKESPLEKMYDIFETNEDIGTIEFTDEDCVRNPIIPKILSTLREHNL